MVMIGGGWSESESADLESTQLHVSLGFSTCPLPGAEMCKLLKGSTSCSLLSLPSVGLGSPLTLLSYEVSFLMFAFPPCIYIHPLFYRFKKKLCLVTWESPHQEEINHPHLIPTPRRELFTLSRESLPPSFSVRTVSLLSQL